MDNVHHIRGRMWDVEKGKVCGACAMGYAYLGLQGNTAAGKHWSDDLWRERKRMRIGDPTWSQQAMVSVISMNDDLGLQMTEILKKVEAYETAGST